MKFFFILSAFLLGFVVSQKEIYVDQQFTGTGNGTEAAPYRNLSLVFLNNRNISAKIYIKNAVYNFRAEEKYQTNSRTAQIALTIQNKNGDPLTFNFTEAGKLTCLNFQQQVNEANIKNVNITLRGINIKTTVTSNPLFYGDCNFVFENFYVDRITSPFMSMKTEGSALIRGLTIDNVFINQSQYLFDQDSRERIEADYLKLDNVKITVFYYFWTYNDLFKNKNLINGQYNAIIRSFLQYRLIEIKNSAFEGVSITVKGEQIGGNIKTDITVQNVTMRNAKTFFFIESYGIISMKDCLFEGATDRAMHFFLTDENLSPQQITFDNCTFNNNQANLEGASVAFQGSKETSGQFSLDVIIQNSHFTSNTAALSGGALAFLLLKNANIQVTSSEFRNNQAAEGGGVFHVDKGEVGMSISLTRNTFDSNSAFTGGVFNFEFMRQVTVTLESNVYTNNAASFEGGIGFISESDLIMKDTNSNGTLNSAEFEGGAWSIKGESKSIKFENINFQDTSARFRGGCIFNSAATMTLQNVNFKNCSTSESGSSGGGLYITETAIIQAQNTKFENNQAEFGASITFQSTIGNQAHTFNTTEIKFDLTNPDFKRTIQSQIDSTKTGLVFNTVTIPTLKTPLLYHTEGAIKLKSVTMSNVQCQAQDGSLTFCIFAAENNGNSGASSLTFTVEDFTLTKVTSQVPLILSTRSTFSLKTVTISDVTSTSALSVGVFQEQSQVKMDSIQLLNIDSNFIQVTDTSTIEITKSGFDNSAKKNGPGTELSTQFLFVSESSLTVTSTKFGFNSVNYPVNGGAIRLTDPVRLQLEDVTFSENKATNGGGLFIEGPSINGLITNCTFSKNTVPHENSTNPGFGAAMYLQSTVVSSRILADQVQSNLTIQKSNFLQNVAYTGGAIYTKEINFVSADNIFDANQAVSGGALAIDITNNDLKIEILRSSFLNNKANLYGASFLQLRNAVVAQSGNTYNNNSQAFDSGAPAAVKIRAFRFKEEVLNIEDSRRNLTELLAQQMITQEYDSLVDKYMLKLENISSGGNLSRLIEISVYDANGIRLSELTSSDGNITLSVVAAQYPENSSRNVASLAGVTTKDLVNGSVTFLQEINIFAFPTTLLDIGVSVLITHRNLGNLPYSLSNRFQIQLLNCNIGEIFRKETLICDPCKNDYFSLTDPFSTSVCQKCETSKADCPGGARIYPKPGYWRISNMSDNVYACPNEYACLGGTITSANNETVYSSTGFCNGVDGYEGNACSTCIPFYGKFGDGNLCTNCRDDPGYYVRLFVLLAIQISLIIFNVYSNLGLIAEQDKTKEKLTIYQSTVIKVLVDYAQVLGIVSSIQINWPAGLGDFGSVVSKSVPSSKDAFSIDCFFSIAQGNNDNIFFYKILILNIQPFAFFLFGTIFWLLLTKIRRQPFGLQFRNNLLVTNCLIAYVLQPEIVKTTLQLFKCVNLGPKADPETYLEKDMQVQCGTGVHLAWALGIGVPSIVFWLVFPVGLFTKIMMQVNKYNDQDTMNRYHFVFKRYNKDKIYWDLNIIVRKAALIFFLVFLSDLYSQIFFSFAVFIFSLHLHYKKGPYTDDFKLEGFPKNSVTLNSLETLGLMSNCFLLFGGLFFIEETEFGVVHGFLMAIALLVNILFLLRVLRAFWWVFSVKAKNILRNRKKPKQTYIEVANNQNNELVRGDEEDKKPDDMEKKPDEKLEESMGLFEKKDPAHHSDNEDHEDHGDQEEQRDRENYEDHQDREGQNDLDNNEGLSKNDRTSS